MGLFRRSPEGQNTQEMRVVFRKEVTYPLAEEITEDTYPELAAKMPKSASVGLVVRIPIGTRPDGYDYEWRFEVYGNREEHQSEQGQITLDPNGIKAYLFQVSEAGGLPIKRRMNQEEVFLSDNVTYPFVLRFAAPNQPQWMYYALNPSEIYLGKESVTFTFPQLVDPNLFLFPSIG